ncbi:MAG: hypothetical protein QW035_01420 [Candidatus Anstonellales archaeon]
MRLAQVTAEFLLVGIVALSLLAVSIETLSYLKDAGDRISEISIAKQEAGEISSAINFVCSSGDGNSVSLSIRGKVVDGNLVYGRAQEKISSNCAFSSIERPSRAVNRNGMIFLE